MKNHKILLVEDDPAIREMYTLKLRATNYLLEVAKDGREGLEKATGWLPDLILLDLKMPHLPGEKLLEHVRQQHWGANMKVIILTNTSKSEAPSILRFLHVDRYIVKAHTTPGEIVKHIDEVLT